MTESNPIIKNLRESAGFRLAVLFGSFFISLLLTSIIAAIIEKLPGDSRTHFLITSTFQCILAFCLPAFLLAKFSSNKWEEWLRMTKMPSVSSLVGVIIVYLLSMPAMEWLIEWNANIHFPDSFSSLENLLRTWESNAEKSTQVVLEAYGFLPVFTGVCVVGILTGFSEELFFHGGFQGILSRSSMGKNTAIWCAAILFSVMHFQFFGFVPRLIMGLFFGYLLLWTQSIWVPIFAHALNNSIVVIVSGVTDETDSSIIDPISMLNINGTVSLVLSVAMTATFLILFRKRVFMQSQKYIWRRNQTA